MVEVKYNIDKNKHLIESLISTYYKFTDKFAATIEKVDGVADEVHSLQKEVRNGLKPDYTRLNIICDRIDEIKDELDHNNHRDLVIELAQIKKVVNSLEAKADTFTSSNHNMGVMSTTLSKKLRKYIQSLMKQREN